MTLKFSRAIALLIISFACGSAFAAVPGVSVRSVKGDFDDVRERVVMALESRGLVLNYTAHISNMLERTGKDIGRARQIYGTAELLEFCSAALSRTMSSSNLPTSRSAFSEVPEPTAGGLRYETYTLAGSLGSV